ncbi:MAG TPA: cystathionine gamma-synthase [Thermoanaerobaculia bacterium]|nr:cystathionine gamma-synthase [Thermoanaerobaculia bacterium]
MSYRFWGKEGTLVKGDPRKLGFSTRAIHAGQPPDPRTGAVNVPIYQTSTYVQEGLGENKGYEYARLDNPTRDALEANVAALEGGYAGHAFASGMAAISALMTLWSAGDHVIVSEDVYGGTYRLFDKVLERYGLRFSWVDTTNLAAVQAAFTGETRMVFLETPTNPMMQISDIAAIAEIAHARGAIVAVDNTFLSPYLQRPLALGADVVVHSGTKFLNGHSDVLNGMLVSSRKEHAEAFAFAQKCSGGVPSPFECFLVLRGLKTLPVRMERHEQNARAIAGYLVRHPKVKRVLYAGLTDHPGYEIQKRQASGFGSMITFDMGSLEAAGQLLRQVRLLSLAESLGGVESLISHPASMTHASVEPERRRKLGITDGLVRISVGIEDLDDLLADLDQALAGVEENAALATLETEALQPC